MSGRPLYLATLADLRPALVTVLGFSAVTNILMLTGSVYMLQVYDRVLTSGSLPTLYGLFAIVVVLYGFYALYDFLRARMLSRVGLRIDARLGQMAFGRWVDTGLPDSRGASDTQPLRDMDTMRSVIGSPTAGAVFDLPFVPIFLAILFIIHPWLGALTVVGAAISAAIALVGRLITAKSMQSAATLDGTEREFVDKARRNAESVRGMGMQAALTRRWTQLHDDGLSSGQSGSDPAELLASGSRAFRMLLQSAILTMGAVLVLQGQITSGMIIASSILSGRVLAPIDQMIGQWRTIGRALAAHKRLLRDFADTQSVPHYMDLPAPTGVINVRDLSKTGASRPGTESSQILSKLTFDLKPGDGLGVIGSSASGKSTLARIMVGAIDPDEGEIRFDGATPDQWDPNVFGRYIGYLPQHVDLLPGSIRDNIARFDPEASDTAVMAAAKLTGVHDMILGLPEGYSTRMGYSGDPVALSGGQIQRIGLARAVYGAPPLIVLDEPNSNLDIAGDKALTQTIAAMRAAGSVVIVMAHRPSALAALDTLMVLDAGQIKLFGPKDTVLGHDKPTAPKASGPAPSQLPMAAQPTASAPQPKPAAPAVAPAAARPVPAQLATKPLSAPHPTAQSQAATPPPAAPAKAPVPQAAPQAATPRPAPASKPTPAPLPKVAQGSPKSVTFTRDSKIAARRASAVARQAGPHRATHPGGAA